MKNNLSVQIDDEVEANVTFRRIIIVKSSRARRQCLVKINEIKVKELPEVNDEFASEVSEFETLDEYKASIKETDRAGKGRC